MKTKQTAQATETLANIETVTATHTNQCPIDKLIRDCISQCKDFESRNPTFAVKRRANGKRFEIVNGAEAPNSASPEYLHYAAYRVSVNALALAEKVKALMGAGLNAAREEAKRKANK